MRAPFRLCPECGATVRGDVGPNMVLDRPVYNRAAIASGEYGFRCTGCRAWVPAPVEAETMEEAQRLSREIRAARAETGPGASICAMSRPRRLVRSRLTRRERTPPRPEPSGTTGRTAWASIVSAVSAVSAFRFPSVGRKRRRPTAAPSVAA